MFCILENSIALLNISSFSQGLTEAFKHENIIKLMEKPTFSSKHECSFDLSPEDETGHRPYSPCTAQDVIGNFRQEYLYCHSFGSLNKVVDEAICFFQKHVLQEDGMSVKLHQKPHKLCCMRKERVQPKPFSKYKDIISTSNGQMTTERTIQIMQGNKSVVVAPPGRKSSTQYLHDERTFSCPMADCSKVFGRVDELNRHFRSHSDYRPFACSICLKKFLRSDHLRTHKRTHTGEKPYQCNICPKRFSRRDGCERHKKTHNRWKSKKTKRKKFSKTWSAIAEKTKASLCNEQKEEYTREKDEH